MKKPRRIPTAGDLMIRHVITVSPEMELIDAIHILLREKISGAPVVDADDNVVGMLSEHDCLRIFALDEYSAEDYKEAGSVGAFMSPVAHTISPELDIYGIAQLFLTRRIRRLPVVKDGKLVGQVSRRDVLGAIDRMRDARLRPPRAGGQPGLYLSATESSPDIIAERLE